MLASLRTGFEECALKSWISKEHPSLMTPTPQVSEKRLQELFILLLFPWILGVLRRLLCELSDVVIGRRLSVSSDLLIGSK